MIRSDISFEPDSFLRDEEVERRSRKVNFEVLPMLELEDELPFEEECRNGLHDFLQVERISNVAGSKDGYTREIGRGFNPLTDEEKTQKYIEQQHKFAHGAIDEAHYIANEHATDKMENHKLSGFSNKLAVIRKNIKKGFEAVIQKLWLEDLNKEIEKPEYYQKDVVNEVKKDNIKEQKLTYEHVEQVLHSREESHFQGRSR